MNISFTNVVLDLTQDEVFCLRGHILRSLETGIREHWVNHPDSFEKLESVSLNMLRHLSRITNLDYDYDLRQLRELLCKCVDAKKLTV